MKNLNEEVTKYFNLIKEEEDPKKIVKLWNKMNDEKLAIALHKEMVKNDFLDTFLARLKKFPRN